MKLLELLAPAKNLSGGKKAINYGADAVYIGADRFGARKQAGNSLPDIAALIGYAHLYRSKVYITLNTLFYQEELEDVHKLIVELYNIGADALIIQDVAILEMDLPPIPIHASTQMHNSDLLKIKFWEENGFKRVVLARELLPSEISTIRANTNIELECFIHGALCVCYSGQCYLSEYIGGRSANRGMCAQPCRLPYNLLDKNKQKIIENKHLLSLKDMNRAEYLSGLIHAGVSSFKIEGRLKDEPYITNVVSYYRQLLDDFMTGNNGGYKKASIGNTLVSFMPDVEKTFNRGYIPYFIDEHSSGLANFDTPKSLGKYIGKVDKIQQNAFHLNTTETIINGDGLCWITGEGLLDGSNVDSVDGNWIKKTNNHTPAVGTEVFRNYDHAFISMLGNDKATRRIKCTFLLEESPGGFVLRLTDEQNNQTTIDFPLQKELARNPESAQQNIINQLKKSGDSIFVVDQVFLNLDNDYFFPISALNAMRRKAFEYHERFLLQSYTPVRIEYKKNRTKYPLHPVDFRLNVTNPLAEQFYRDRGAETDKLFLEEPVNWKGKIIFTSKYCLRRELNSCLKKNHGKNAQDPFYLSYNDYLFRLQFDCGKCCMHLIAE